MDIYYNGANARAFAPFLDRLRYILVIVNMYGFINDACADVTETKPMQWRCASVWMDRRGRRSLHDYYNYIYIVSNTHFRRDDSRIVRCRCIIPVDGRIVIRPYDMQSFTSIKP